MQIPWGQCYAAVTKTEVSIDICFAGPARRAVAPATRGSLGAMYGHLRLWLGSGLAIFGGLWLWDRLSPSADVPGLVATWWPAALFAFGLLGVLRLLLHKPAAWIP